MMVNVEVSVGLQAISTPLGKQNTQLWKYLFLMSVGKLRDNHQFYLCGYRMLQYRAITLLTFFVNYRRLVLN